MTYSKPEITVLGESAYVIHGSKNIPPENGDPDVNAPLLFELED